MGSGSEIPRVNDHWWEEIQERSQGRWWPTRASHTTKVLPELIVWTILKARASKSTNSDPVLSFQRLAPAFKDLVYTLGHLKHELLVVVDKKVRTFVKTSKT